MHPIQPALELPGSPSDPSLVAAPFSGEQVDVQQTVANNELPLPFAEILDSIVVDTTSLEIDEASTDLAADELGDSEPLAIDAAPRLQLLEPQALDVEPTTGTSGLGDVQVQSLQVDEAAISQATESELRAIAVEPASKDGDSQVASTPKTIVQPTDDTLPPPRPTNDAVESAITLEPTTTATHVAPVDRGELPRRDPAPLSTERDVESEVSDVEIEARLPVVASPPETVPEQSVPPRLDLESEISDAETSERDVEIGRSSDDSEQDDVQQLGIAQSDVSRVEVSPEAEVQDEIVATTPSPPRQEVPIDAASFANVVAPRTPDSTERHETATPSVADSDPAAVVQHGVSVEPAAIPFVIEEPAKRVTPIVDGEALSPEPPIQIATPSRPAQTRATSLNEPLAVDAPNRSVADFADSSTPFDVQPIAAESIERPRAPSPTSSPDVLASPIETVVHASPTSPPAVQSVVEPTASSSSQPPSVGEQLIDEVKVTVERQQGKLIKQVIEVQLDPPDLGQIVVQVEKSLRGVSAHVSAVDETALQLLQQDSATIVRALDELGVELSGFSLTQHSDQREQQSTQNHEADHSDTHDQSTDTTTKQATNTTLVNVLV